ncbi:MAG: DNA polymerase Y family protein [Phycisphaerales bacterium]|nr:DNA polymerase Y family protein [Phycisphaerales bacterium]
MSLPRWASDLAARRSHLDPMHAVILSRIDHQREVVGSCCAMAARAGVFPGMTVAHARALLPPARTHVESLDDALAERSLRRFAAWMIRFVPTVAVDPPDGLWLDATGCERLYGGIDRLAARILGAVGRLGITARLAGAPTWGAAWALARYTDDPSPLPPELSELRSVLSPMPVAALRIDEAMRDKLHRIGIERIGHLLALPRSALADRYGEMLLLRLDQALGQAVESIMPIRPRTPVMAERMLDGPTDRVEAIEMITRELVGQIAAQLTERECGCRRLEVTLFRSDLDPLTFAVQTARPTRDARHLWTLVRPNLESAHLGFGVEGVRVRAHALARLLHRQEAAWEVGSDGGASADSGELGKLVDTLTARLGTGRVLRLRPVESHLPERAFDLETVTGIEDRPRSSGPALIDADRPSLLFRRPIPINAMFLVPDGPITRVNIGADTPRIVACIGPERIEPEWWRGYGGYGGCGGGGGYGGYEGHGTAARDYFKAQTETGRWLWIFREVRHEGTSARWFLHGEWA